MLTDEQSKVVNDAKIYVNETKTLNKQFMYNMIEIISQGFEDRNLLNDDLRCHSLLGYKSGSVIRTLCKLVPEEVYAQRETLLTKEQYEELDELLEAKTNEDLKRFAVKPLANET